MKPDELRLRYYGDPVLRQKAGNVDTFDDLLDAQADTMFEIMYENDGLGLAGNQVGLLRRLVVLDVPLGEEQRAVMVLVNPEILESTGKETAEEGCLSIPEVRDDVTRPDAIKVRARNLAGEEITFEARDLLARAIQHEVDHLYGVLFVDRLSAVKRKMIEGKLKQVAQEYAAG